DFFWFFLLRLLLKALINFFSLTLLLLGLSDTRGTIEDSGSSTFSLSSAAIDGNGGTNLVIVVDDVRGIKEFLRGGTDLIGTRCVLQYEKKKYPREENVVDGYGNDMVLSDNQILEWTDRDLSLLFFSKTNKGLNFGLKRKVCYNMVAVKRLRENSSPHSRMILASVEKGPLVWPSITVDGVTRLKEYTELTPAEAIQADCDIKEINIILQGLPT
ncbi:hypothetical protein Tco_0252011, partial [Tanacetum coccineum]